MSMPAYAAAIAFALQRLRSELPPALVYHNLWHTEQDVMVAAVRIARASGLAEADLRLLEVAAAYHDIGMIDTLVEHERRGAAIAAEALPRYGFNQAQILQVDGMIMATRLPQSPRSLPEQILADADLDVLGRDDFMERNGLLRQELAALGQTASDQEWYRAQRAFLEQHAYFTPAANRLRAEGLRANLERFSARFG